MYKLCCVVLCCDLLCENVAKLSNLVKEKNFMRQITLLLIMTFVMLRFGYPAYQDWQLKKQVRSMMQSAKTPEVPDNFRDLPIKMEMENHYPTTKLIYTLTDVDYQSMSNSQAVDLTEAVKEIPCRNLYAYKKLPNTMWTPIVEVLKEDKVSLTIEVKDKNGNLIEQNSQILSQCDNFSEVFTYSTADEYKLKVG